jgi:phosphate starvation-inducible membrane PsiE
VLNGRSSEKLMLNGGSIVCSMLSLVLYPKCVYFASLTLIAEYWGSGRHMPLNKGITIT